MKSLNAGNDALFIGEVLPVDLGGGEKRMGKRLVKEGPLRQCDNCGSKVGSYYIDSGDVVCVDCYRAKRAEEADRDYWKEKARMLLTRTERKRSG